MLEGGKRCAQHLRGRPIATQLIHSLLAPGRGGSELHRPLSEGGSLAAAASVEHMPFVGALSPDLRSPCARLATVAPAAPLQASAGCQSRLRRGWDAPGQTADAARELFPTFECGPRAD